MLLNHNISPTLKKTWRFNQPLWLPLVTVLGGQHYKMYMTLESYLRLNLGEKPTLNTQIHDPSYRKVKPLWGLDLKNKRLPSNKKQIYFFIKSQVALNGTYKCLW